MSKPGKPKKPSGVQPSRGEVGKPSGVQPSTGEVGRNRGRPRKPSEVPESLHNQREGDFHSLDN